jgi:hypothetical protein
VLLIFSPVGLLVVSQADLLGRSVSGGAGVLLFLSVTCHGETLYGLGVQGVEALIPLGTFFLPRVALASQQNF